MSTHAIAQEGGAPARFRYTADDFVAANRLHAWPTRRGFLLCIVYFLCLLAVLYLIDRNLDSLVRSLPYMLIGIAAWLVLAWYVLLPWVARRSYAKYPMAQFAFSFDLRPEGVECVYEAGRLTYRWQDFVKWRTGKETTLVYLSPRLFLHFPQHMGDEGFPLDALRAELLRHLGPPLR